MRTDDAVTVSPSGGIIDLDGGNNITTSGAGSAATVSLTGTTDHAVQLGNATGSLTSLLGTDNTALLGVTGLDPIFGSVPNATLTNSSMTFTAGDNITFTGSPVSLGGAGTIAVSGTTDHGVQVGNASGSLTSLVVGVSNTALIGVTGADPEFGTIPNAMLDNSTITLNNGTNITITGSPISLGGAGTVALSGMIDRALHVGNASGGLTSLGVAGNGQIPIGSGGLDPVLATLTAGSNITITNAGGSITIASTGGGASQFDGDSGSATPAAGVIDILGGSNITTVASGSSVTANLDNTVSISGSMTATTGLITTAGNITFPDTTSSSVGVLRQTGTVIYSGFNSNNFFAGSGNFTTTGVNNIGISNNSLASLTSGDNNFAIGGATLTNCETGSNNVAFGQSSMRDFVSGNTNSTLGNGTLLLLTSGDSNSAMGYESLKNLLTGSFNTGLGFDSGTAYTGAESSNILIKHVGVNAESNTIRLGTNGAGNGQQNKCFVAGVRGITTGIADAVAVLVDSAHQFGTVSSSIRVKKNVEDMGTATGSLFELRPVLFDYIESPSERRQYGLIAEEVEKVMPDLVVYDKSSTPETVRYHELPVMLLNEMKKLKDRIEKLEANCTCKD